MATIQAIAEMQPRLFGAIGKLDARLKKMETRFRTVESSMTDLRVEVIGRDV